MRHDGVAYLAYLDREPNAEGKRATGTIMLVDLNAAEPRVRAALATDPPDFRPCVEPGDCAGRRATVVRGRCRRFRRSVFEQSATGRVRAWKNDYGSVQVGTCSSVATLGKRTLVGHAFGTAPPAWCSQSAPAI